MIVLVGFYFLSRTHTQTVSNIILCILFCVWEKMKDHKKKILYRWLGVSEWNIYILFRGGRLQQRGEEKKEIYRHARLNDLHICFRISPRECDVCIYIYIIIYIIYYCIVCKHTRSIPKLIIPTFTSTKRRRRRIMTLDTTLYIYFAIYNEVMFSFVRIKRKKHFGTQRSAEVNRRTLNKFP